MAIGKDRRAPRSRRVRGLAPDAEDLAQPWATDADGLHFWEACLIVVRSLQARDRQADAEAFLAGHDLNLHDMDDVYFD